MKSKVEAFYDRDAPIYDARYDGDPFFVLGTTSVATCPLQGGRILDAGGGTGRAGRCTWRG